MVRAYNAKQWEVRAILDGRKSCIRIAVKYKYCNTEMKIKSDKHGSRLIEIQKDVEGETYGKNPDGSTWHRLLPYIEKIPLYKKGDILYVKEIWGTYNKNWWEADYFLYRADYPANATTYTHPDGMICDLPKWRPSIQMPKEAARIWLKVTDVRVERLQDITEDEAKAEGAIDNRGFIHSPDNEYDSIHTAREHFAEIWNSTIKKSDLERYGWDANPYVLVIEFERCEKPEDA